MHLHLTYLVLLISLALAQAQPKSNIDEQMERATALLDSARYDEALNLVLPLEADVVALGIENQSQYYNLLGNCYHDKRDYEQAFLQFEKAQKLLQATNDTNTLLYAQTLNNLGNYYFQIGSFEKSLTRHQQALGIREEQLGKKHPDTADSYNNMANCFLVAGNFDEALAYYQEALVIRRNYWQKNHPDVASVLNNMGNAFLSMGAPEGAVEYYQQALSMRRDLLGATHLKTIDGYQNLGNAFFAAKQLDSALFYTKLSLESLQQHYPDQQIRMASLYNNLGNISTEQRNFQLAQTYLTSALNLQKGLLEDDHLSIADTYQNTGDAFYENTDYKQALLYYRRANGIYKKHLGTRHPLVASVWDKIGLSLQYLGDFNLAENAHHRALSIREDIFGPTHVYVAGTYTNIGNCLWKATNFEIALENYQKALVIWEQQIDAPPMELNKLYNNLGNCYFEMQDLQKALFYYEKAGAYLSEKDLLPALSYYKHKGVIFSRQQQFEQASQSFKAGLTLLEKYSLDIAPIEALLLKNASAENDLQYFHQNNSTSSLYQAHSSYQQAIRLLDQLWKGYLTADSRQTLNDTYFPLFEGAMESCFELWQLSDSLHYLEEAFLLSEKSKSSRLLNAVRLNLSTQLAKIPAEYTKQLQELESQIAYHEKLRQDLFQQNPNALRLILSKDSLILQLKTQRDSIHSSLEQQFPAFRNLMANQQLETIASTQKMLAGTQQQILVFFCGRKNIYAFNIEATSVQAFQIPLDFPLETWLEKLGQSIVQYPFAGGRDASRLDSIYVSFAQSLYQKIWQPLNISSITGKHITLIPDGLLSYLPFEALLTAAPQSAQRYRTYPFLLKDFTISYAYSATLLAEAKIKRKKRAPKKWLGMAPSFENSRIGLSPLDHNQTEVRQLQQLIGGKILTGPEATREQFLAEAPNYRWLHLATHALATGSLQPFLAFSQTQDTIVDEQLFADDLLYRRFPAELVVLSACETGFGSAQPSEGIASLARSFSYAGAKSVITTLWSINDAKTAELMQDFYKRLKRGQPKDQALSETKLHFIEISAHEYAHPFYWAAYLPIGDMSALDKQGFGLWYLLIIAALIGLVAFFWFLKKKESV